MVLEVYPDIYLLEIPLPNNPLRALNSYIIKSDNESL
ncbi:MAG: MBL fold metallo-hydrolase, partial [Tissierellia bacterium]|nr:MBL fold metallo-hydrolase [Tissierellia bacterium]